MYYKKSLASFSLVSCLFWPKLAFASEGALNIYDKVASTLGMPHGYSPLLNSALVLILCLVLGLYFKSKVNKMLAMPIPSNRFGLFEFIESLAAFVVSLAKEQCHDVFSKVLPLMGGLFFFILFSNLTGLIPGFPPVTETFSANLALGIIVFLFYNVIGIYKNGLSYLKHFMGPFLILAPLFIVLETISHCARPLSLAFRLTANIFGDHLLLGVFSNMVPLGVPALLMCFGLLVAFIQSFVFTVLTSIYVNMAISHDDH